MMAMKCSKTKSLIGPALPFVTPVNRTRIKVPFLFGPFLPEPTSPRQGIEGVEDLATVHGTPTNAQHQFNPCTTGNKILTAENLIIITVDYTNYAPLRRSL